MAVEGEEERVFLCESGELSSAGKPKLTIKLTGIVKTQDVVGLAGEEVFAAGDETESSVVLED